MILNCPPTISPCWAKIGPLPSSNTAVLRSAGPTYPMNAYGTCGGLGAGGVDTTEMGAAAGGGAGTVAGVGVGPCWYATDARPSVEVGDTRFTLHLKIFLPEGSYAGRGAANETQSTGYTLRSPAPTTLRPSLRIGMIRG